MTAKTAPRMALMMKMWNWVKLLPLWIHRRSSSGQWVDVQIYLILSMHLNRLAIFTSCSVSVYEKPIQVNTYGKALVFQWKRYTPPRSDWYGSPRPTGERVRVRGKYSPLVSTREPNPCATMNSSNQIPQSRVQCTLEPHDPNYLALRQDQSHLIIPQFVMPDVIRHPEHSEHTGQC